MKEKETKPFLSIIVYTLLSLSRNVLATVTLQFERKIIQ